MSTEQQWLVTVVIDGVTIGIFDTFSGGDDLAPSAKHRAGGMGQEKDYATLPSYSDGTVSRVYERERDHEVLRGLNGKAGWAKMSVTEQPLDVTGNAWGKPNVYTGKFLGTKRGNIDSTSTNPRMLELDMSVTSIA